MKTHYKTSKIISAPHLITTRTGGFSSFPYDSLNMGFNYGDNNDTVVKNWNLLFSENPNINPKYLTLVKQVHKNKILNIKKGMFDNKPQFYLFGEYDGIITRDIGITLAILTADCASVLLHDKTKHVSAALHCGWKSLTLDIIKSCIDDFMKFGCSLNNINAFVGPCIKKCCFECNIDVANAFENLLGYKDSKKCIDKNINSDKYNIDLEMGVVLRLVQLGINVGNIETVSECTKCRDRIYFSYRKNNNTGRMASIITNV